MESPALKSQLTSLFDAERTARRLHAEIIRAASRDGGATDNLVALLKGEATAARAQTEPEEQAIRLVRIATLLGDLQGAGVVDLLVDLLGGDEPEARHAAGEALEALAFDRFKEVALGIERALARLPAGNAALSELPYLIAEIPEPGATKLLGAFLRHSDPEAVAAAIEALVEVGDPGASTLLAPLEKDTRVVQLEDDEGEEGKVTIGELATEARTMLSDLGGVREGARPRS